MSVFLWENLEVRVRSALATAFLALSSSLAHAGPVEDLMANDPKLAAKIQATAAKNRSDLQGLVDKRSPLARPAYEALGCDTSRMLEHTKFAIAKSYTPTEMAIKIQCGFGESEEGFQREGTLDCQTGKIKMTFPKDTQAPLTPAAKSASRLLCQ